MKNKGIIISVVVLILAAISVGVSCLFLIDTETNSERYEELVKRGYGGTVEEWIASLVGETRTDHMNQESAFLLAKDRGFTGSLGEWNMIISGNPSEDQAATTYEVACQNGYKGTLSEWLMSLVDDPMLLGRSLPNQEKTEYEAACEYGFEGNYIDWMISLVNN